MEANIKVFARIKPLDSGDLDGNCVHISSNSELTVSASGGLFVARRYRLDGVSDHHATQSDVFSNVAPLLQKSLDGYNCSIFMYGQTGSGKVDICRIYRCTYVRIYS